MGWDTSEGKQRGVEKEISRQEGLRKRLADTEREQEMVHGLGHV